MGSYIVSLETLEQATVGDTVYSPKKYLASNWSPMTPVSSTGFTRNAIVDKQLTDASESKVFSFASDNTGTVSTIGDATDEVEFTWQLRHGVLMISEIDSPDVTALSLLKSDDDLITALVVGQSNTVIVERYISVFQVE